MSQDNHLLQSELRRADDADLLKALEWVRIVRDPATRSMWPIFAIGVAGFVGLGFGYRAVARTLAVPLQTPALVSGGLGGLALIVLACLLFSIQSSRGDAARERREWDAVVEEARGLLDVAPKLRPRRAGAVRRTTSKSSAR